MNSFLEDLQFDVATKLMRDFSGIPVFAYSIDNLDARIGTTFGLSIVVMPPIPKRVLPNLAGLAYEKLAVRIRVIEMPSTNDTDYTAISFMQKMCETLCHWKPRTDGVQSPLFLSEDNPWKEIRDPESIGRYILEAEFIISAYPEIPYVRSQSHEH